MKHEPPRTTKEDNSYMPHSDLDKRNWMAGFINKIENSTDRFGIPEEQFEMCRSAVEKFIEAFDVLNLTSDRSPNRVMRKNEARKHAVRECRALAMRLKFDPSIPTGVKHGLGLHIDDTVLTRLQAPKQFPHLIVRSTALGGHEIRFAQRGAASGVTAKPKGVTHLLLFAAVGDGPQPVSEARLIAGVTRQPHAVNFPIGCGADGKTITYYGRWINRKGDMSPWSAGTSMILSCSNAKRDDAEFGHLFAEKTIERAQAQAA